MKKTSYLQKLSGGVSVAKPIMIQGTMSNAGKSFIAAALCRMLKQDGYTCAPFKSQNMALNSYITKDGLEIGRAQAMQAEAAGKEPSVYMNPILLKPTTDVGSQIIVNGVVRGNMKAADYFRYKKQLVPDIMDAYSVLDRENDIIVIEGAGSPAELNLKSDDIVNMGLAKMISSPVLLVGDIDRGGVFAQLIGTVRLLEPDEQELIKALVVNRFRGDRSIFQSGCDILESRSGKPVLGVVPYIRCDIDDEDSLSDRLDRRDEGIIRIAVIRLPRISNFTDFDVFSRFEGVSVNYVTDCHRLENADMIVIPGTKSTISDMRWLRESGMEAMIRKCADRGTPVFGICGGYQMLGRLISDPDNSEGGGSTEGIGLLTGETVFKTEKHQTQTSGRFEKINGAFSFLSGLEYSGYEIHMGHTDTSGSPLLENGGEVCGNVCGCYIHGIFDSDRVSEAVVKELYRIKKIPYTGGSLNRLKYRESQYDLIADNLRNSIDTEMLYRIIGV